MPRTLKWGTGGSSLQRDKQQRQLRAEPKWNTAAGTLICDLAVLTTTTATAALPCQCSTSSLRDEAGAELAAHTPQCKHTTVQAQTLEKHATSAAALQRHNRERCGSQCKPGAPAERQQSASRTPPTFPALCCCASGPSRSVVPLFGCVSTCLCAPGVRRRTMGWYFSCRWWSTH